MKGPDSTSQLPRTNSRPIATAVAGATPARSSGHTRQGQQQQLQRDQSRRSASRQQQYIDDQMLNIQQSWLENELTNPSKHLSSTGKLPTHDGHEGSVDKEETQGPDNAGGERQAAPKEAAPSSGVVGSSEVAGPSGPGRRVEPDLAASFNPAQQPSTATQQNTQQPPEPRQQPT